jgi:hypothetical protein
MIARFEVLLPAGMVIAPETEMEPFEREVDGYRIRVYPPYRSVLDHSALEFDSTEPLFEIPRLLDRVDPQPATGAVLVEGLQTVQVDVLRIDFVGREFDRRRGADDPPIELALRVADDLLARLRTLGRAGHLKPVGERAIWRVAYLRDDESVFEPSEELARARNAVSWRVKLLALRPSLWDAAGAPR